MKYGVEVLVEEPGSYGQPSKKVWKRMHPTNGPAYEWDTREEAQRNIFAGVEHRDSYRVVEC